MGLMSDDSQWLLELYTDLAGGHRWRLRATNGRVVADSGESYTRREDARDAAERLKDEAGTAIIVDLD